MAYCSGRAGNEYIPEEVSPDLLKRCQLFPQPLTDEELREKIEYYGYFLLFAWGARDAGSIEWEEWELYREDCFDQVLILFQQRQKPLAYEALVGIDIEILDLVEALNLGGIPTIGSCSGHGKEHGYIVLKDERTLIILPAPLNKDYVTRELQFNQSIKLKVESLANETLRDMLDDYARDLKTFYLSPKADVSNSAYKEYHRIRDKALTLLQQREQEAKKELMKEIAKDMRERFKPLKIEHGRPYIPLSAIEHFIMRLDFGTWQALKGRDK